MEVKAAEIIFHHCIQEQQLVHSTMLCDGDSKVITYNNEKQVSDIPVIKEDCKSYSQAKV